MPRMWKGNSPLQKQSYFLWPFLIVLLRAYQLMVLEHYHHSLGDFHRCIIVTNVLRLSIYINALSMVNHSKHWLTHSFISMYVTHFLGHWVISINFLILAFKGEMRRLSTGKSSGLKGPIINCWSTANHCKSCIYSLSNQRPTSGSQSRPIHNRSCSKVVSCGPQQIIVT